MYDSRRTYQGPQSSESSPLECTRKSKSNYRRRSKMDRWSAYKLLKRDSSVSASLGTQVLRFSSFLDSLSSTHCSHALPYLATSL